MRHFPSFVSLGLAALILAAPRGAGAQDTAGADEPEGPAAADGPAAAEAAGPALFEISGGGAFLSPPVAGGITPFGVGVGGTAGLFLSRVYVGANVRAFLGGQDDAGSSERALLYGGEVGYELRLTEWLTLRPFVGAGGATVTHSLQSSTTATTSTINGRTGRTSAVDVITQATSSSGGGGGGSSSNTTETTVSAAYVEPGVMAKLTSRGGAYAGLGGSVVYFPSVPYDANSSASWRSFGAFLRLGYQF